MIGFMDRLNAMPEEKRLYTLATLPSHLAGASQEQKLRQILTTFDFLQAKVDMLGPQLLILDYDLTTERALRLLQGALRLSAHILVEDKTQLASQLLARISEQEKQLRDEILKQVLIRREVWLRPLTASLTAERSIRWLRPMEGETLDSVVFSPNGRWAAYVSGSFGPTPRNVVLWNLEEWQSYGSRFQTLARLNPFALALSNDSRWCFYADSVGGVHRLDALGDGGWDGHAHRDLTIAVLLAISSDGQRALSACQHGRLVAWDIGAGLHEIVYDESDNYIEALSLDEQGHSGVVARRDGSIVRLDLWPARLQIMFVLNGRPSALARSSDNSVVAAATEDGRIEVHLAVSPESLIGEFVTQEKPTTVALSSANRYLAVGTEKGTVEVWNIESGIRSAQYRGAHTYEVKQIAFSHDDAHVISADLLQIKEWAIEVYDEEELEATIPRATGQVKVTADGLHVVAVLEDGRLGMWNIFTGAMVSVLPRAPGPSFGDPNIGLPKQLARAANVARILAWNERLLCIWDLEPGGSVRSLSVADTRDAAITSDGTSIVYIDGKAISQWKPDEGKFNVLGTYDGDPPGYITISPDGKRALTSGGDRSVFEWHIDATEPSSLPASLARLRTRPAWSNSWRPDSRDKPSTIAFTGPEEAVFTSGDGTMFMLQIGKNELQRFEGRHGSSANRLLVSNDGTLVVTSSYDRKIMIWHLDSCRRLAEFDAHPGTIEQLSASGQHALLYTFDGVVKIVSLRDGSVIATFQSDKQILTCAADVELRWVVACDQGGQMHFLHLEDGT